MGSGLRFTILTEDPASENRKNVGLTPAFSGYLLRRVVGVLPVEQRRRRGRVFETF
jgi:hypothetical protein